MRTPLWSDVEAGLAFADVGSIADMECTYNLKMENLNIDSRPRLKV